MGKGRGRDEQCCIHSADRFSRHAGLRAIDHETLRVLSSALSADGEEEVTSRSSRTHSPSVPPRRVLVAEFSRASKLSNLFPISGGLVPFHPQKPRAQCAAVRRFPWCSAQRATALGSGPNFSAGFSSSDDTSPAQWEVR